MPLYEYHCKECDQSFEKVVRFSETDHPQTCPACQSQNTLRKVSKVASFSVSAGASFSPASGASSCGSGGGFS